MDTKEKVLRNLSYGLYQIGVMDGQRPCGCIINTVFQVTSENPIVAISMHKDNYTWELIEKENRFSVSTFRKRPARKSFRSWALSPAEITTNMKGCIIPSRMDCRCWMSSAAVR